MFAEIAVPINLNRPFTYKIPEALHSAVKVGFRVLVPFKNKKLTGYVIKLTKTCELKGVKEIIQLLDDIPLFSQDDLKFFKWLSSYYITPLAEVIKTALPSGINQKSKKYYSITADGEAYIAKPGAKHADLIRFISESGSISADAIKRGFYYNNLTALLGRLEKKGLISSQEVVSKRDLKRSFDTYILVNEPQESFFIDYISALPKNATKISKVALFILEKNELPYNELTKMFGSVKSVIDKLAALEYIKVELREKKLGADHGLIADDTELTLTTEQCVAVKKLDAALENESYAPFLLQGVTGSGKTEVYIRAAKRTVASGKGVIILVPEIALTPHYIKRFTHHFDDVAVMHSSISPKEKHQHFLKVLSGETQLVIGVRSAIFAPFKELGLIVVDEEHETTYKQDDGFKYNARDVALIRGKMKDATVVLGSATPSLESYNNAKNGRFGLLRLTKRVNEQGLPEVTVVDIKDEKIEGDKKSMILSKTLIKEIRANLKRKRQTVLFLNRRGHSSFVVCYDCGETEECPNCTISLTYHRSDNSLTCHYCGFKKELKGLCAKCESSRLRPVGFGTQRAYEVVKGYFKEANIFRMDSDTMTRRDSYIDFYKRMESGEIDIVIGTKMIAKGHDFQNVTLVGILNADSGLMMPDFRAEERSFIEITQVSGRAGRGDSPGKVVIQTMNPESDHITHAINGDVDKFFIKQLELRKTLGFPPFTRMAAVKIVARSEASGVGAFNSLATISHQMARGRKYSGVTLLGPTECPIYKIKNRYRWQMLVRSADSKELHLFLGELNKRLNQQINKSYVKINIDVDPINML